MKASDFQNQKTQSVAYDPKQATRRGYTSIDVLPFLSGKAWDDVALGFVHGLHPRYIRVCNGSCQLDARTDRVTVWVNDKNLITKITQEIEVWLPEGVAHGAALRDALHHGIDSKEVEWQRIKGGECWDTTTGEIYKTLQDGTVVYHPRSAPKLP